MAGKFRITVEVDPDTREITIRDDDGNERTIRSVILLGGDAERGAFYLFGWGSSADAAWAYKQGFLHAFRDGDPSYRNFYKQCACHLVQCLCPDVFRRETEPEEILDRWGWEDRGEGSWQ